MERIQLYAVLKYVSVIFRWWMEARNVAKETGILYYVSVRKDDEEILLDLTRVKYTRNFDNATEWLACQEYALIHWTMWLQALKWCGLLMLLYIFH